MANISDAQGDFSFSPEFYKKHQELITNYFEKASLMAEYGIDIEDDQENGTFSFIGSGRWSMENSLSWVLAPVDFAEKSTDFPLFTKLYQAMQAEKAEVTFEYNDYEPGVQFYIHQEATIVANPDVDINKSTDQDLFLITKNETEDLGYDNYIRVSNDLEDGYLMNNENDRETIDKLVKEYYSEHTDKYPEIANWDEFKNKFHEAVKDDEDYQNAICSYQLDDMDDLMDSLI